VDNHGLEYPELCPACGAHHIRPGQYTCGAKIFIGETGKVTTNLEESKCMEFLFETFSRTGQLEPKVGRA
jgi:hypothetical protein